MKAVDIVGTAIRNAFRSRPRTSLTVLAIFIGAFTLSLTNGLGTGINQYIDDTVAAIGADDVMTVTKVAENATDAGRPARVRPRRDRGAPGRPPGTTTSPRPAARHRRARRGGRRRARAAQASTDYIATTTGPSTDRDRRVRDRDEGGAGRGRTARRRGPELVIPDCYLEALGWDAPTPSGSP